MISSCKALICVHINAPTKTGDLPTDVKSEEKASNVSSRRAVVTKMKKADSVLLETIDLQNNKCLIGYCSRQAMMDDPRTQERITKGQIRCWKETCDQVVVMENIAMVSSIYQYPSIY